MNKAAVNIAVQVFFCGHAFSFLLDTNSEVKLLYHRGGAGLAA